MSEALNAVIDYGFKELLLEGIDADTYCENARSIVLMERLGFNQLEQVEDYYKFALEREIWRLL